MNAVTLRLGSRRSPMAVAQSRRVADQITAATGREVEIVGVTTLGDVNRAALTQIGGTGVFVSALRDALLHGEIDFAVHSLKDLPAVQPPDIALAAVPRRDDPRDALVARDGAKLADLSPGARIGTGSLRRAAQVLALRADLRCVPIRGNADTRMAKIGKGEVDAVVLAYAGLERIGHLDAVTQVFEPEEMLPAPGQGALAVECRTTDSDLAELLGVISDPHTVAATIAERSLLVALAAGCHAPVAAYAAAPGPRTAGGVSGERGLDMHAVVMSVDGTTMLRAHGVGRPANARQLGRDLAADLLRSGAEELIRVPEDPANSGNDVQ
ncbi:MAG TPA: hydroxymethylbilane synthase [Streptosporangiaceae bacterium]|nr:hydroxymethylbilane synthase [Streptosporangiaceae bacterium]